MADASDVLTIESCTLTAGAGSYTIPDDVREVVLIPSTNGVGCSGGDPVFYPVDSIWMTTDRFTVLRHDDLGGRKLYFRVGVGEPVVTILSFKRRIF